MQDGTFSQLNLRLKWQGGQRVGLRLACCINVEAVMFLLCCCLETESHAHHPVVMSELTDYSEEKRKKSIRH